MSHRASDQNTHGNYFCKPSSGLGATSGQISNLETLLMKSCKSICKQTCSLICESSFKWKFALWLVTWPEICLFHGGTILAFNMTFIYSFIYSCYSRRFGLVRIIKLFLLVNQRTQHQSLSDLNF